MASIWSRTSKRVPLLVSRPSVLYPRWLSSTTRNKVEPNTAGEVSTQQTPSGQEALNIRFYEAPHRLKRQEFNRNWRHDGFIHINDPEEELQNSLKLIFNHACAAVILRDACRCSKCKDSSTSQRDFNVAHIPPDLKPMDVKKDAHGNWHVKWRNDMPGWEEHTSIFTPRHIERLRVYLKNEHQTSSRLWNKEEMARERYAITYDEYMNSEPGLAKSLYHLARHGLMFITHVPEDEHSVERLANRIAHLKSSFYGPTWNVRSVPNAINVAYTSKYLGFHADLLYLKEPPTVQFLHCIHNSAKGGESRFVDQFKALDVLFSENKSLAAHLAKTNLRYEYENDGYYYSDIKPVVQWRTDSHQFPQRKVRGAANDEIGHVYRMFWSPQFLGSIVGDNGIHKTHLEKSMQAMKAYADILEREDLIYEEKMEQGTCVVFDNLRVLHARNEFDMNSGKRWLKGTYVDGQDLWSKEMQFKDHLAKFELEKQKFFRTKKDPSTAV